MERLRLTLCGSPSERNACTSSGIPARAVIPWSLWPSSYSKPRACWVGLGAIDSHRSHSMGALHPSGDKPNRIVIGAHLTSTLTSPPLSTDHGHFYVAHPIQCPGLTTATNWATTYRNQRTNGQSEDRAIVAHIGNLLSLCRCNLVRSLRSPDLYHVEVPAELRCGLNARSIRLHIEHCDHRSSAGSPFEDNRTSTNRPQPRVFSGTRNSYLFSHDFAFLSTCHNMGYWLRLHGHGNGTSTCDCSRHDALIHSAWSRHHYSCPLCPTMVCRLCRFSK